MFTLIAIPDSFVASTTAMMGQFFSDFYGPITLIFGSLLGASVLAVIIGSFRK